MRWVRHNILAITLGLPAAISTMSGCEKPESPTADKPVIAVTIYPLADLTRQIVGDAAEVTSLVPPGVSPHGFELTAAAARDLHRAKMLVMVGLNFDEWARQALLGTSEKHAPIVEMADTLGIKSAAAAPDHKHDAHDHDHDDLGPNPHLWVDPVLARQFVETLGPRLVELLPEHRVEIEKRTGALVADLQKLDADSAQQLKPYAGRKIITFHNAFNRLAARYGLIVAATLAPIESPGALTFDAVQRVLEVIRKERVDAVFSEPLAPGAADVMKQAAKIKVLTLDDLGNPADPKRDTYQHLMRYNLDTLIKGLSITHE